MARAKQVKSLSKLQSRITKKKGKSGSKTLHENSRDAKALDRASLRNEKIALTSSVRKAAFQPYLERIAVFQGVVRGQTSGDDSDSEAEEEAEDEAPELMDTTKDQGGPLTDCDLHDTVTAYLRRDESELAELKATRRPGRPASTREDVLVNRRVVEEREFISGFWIPDARDAETVGFLKRWDGQWASLALMRFVRVNKEGTVKESRFPPKGES